MNLQLKIVESLLALSPMQKPQSHSTQPIPPGIRCIIANRFCLIPKSDTKSIIKLLRHPPRKYIWSLSQKLAPDKTVFGSKRPRPFAALLRLDFAASSGRNDTFQSNVSHDLRIQLWRRGMKQRHSRTTLFSRTHLPSPGWCTKLLCYVQPPWWSPGSSYVFWSIDRIVSCEIKLYHQQRCA